MTQEVVLNPWELAMNPVAPTQVYWGQMVVEAHLVVLVKGIGKMPYEANTVMPDGSEPRPVTAVNLTLQPLAEMGLQWEITREPIAQGWGEWGDITLPSLRECGILELPALNGMWAKAELEPTGRKYTNRNGEPRDATAFKFLKVFASEAECRADYNGKPAGNGKRTTDEILGELGYETKADKPANGPANGVDKDRETALKFAKVYVQNACRASGGDLTKARDELAPKLAGQPLISKYFTVDSPEIVEMMAEVLTK